MPPEGSRMQTLLGRISEEMGRAFEKAGYDPSLGTVTVSNRPDLCEYQCNGAMAGAKQYHKAPFMIADEVAAAVGEDSEVFASVTSVKPGFLNLDLKDSFLTGYLREMAREEKFGLEMPAKRTLKVMDYGGPNVAKPLHVGHLRSAVIGEAIKRIAKYNGEEVIADIHMGDWGLQMGLVITELRHRFPDLVYFDPSFDGSYPEDAPFTVSDLEEIYPAASKKSKEDPEYYAEAMETTKRLQEKERGIYDLWKKIYEISVADVKRNYADLDVDFDLWNGEATVNDLIPGMVEEMKRGGYAYTSEGALVVDVSEESDSREIPPCIILKSDGAALYTTTDLATILDRVSKYHPDEIFYVTDKRQELHFVQVFRAARKCGIIPEETKLTHVGFGTVNGKDGKPFKTRDGGVMRLSTLIADIRAEMLEKIRSNPEIAPEETEEIASQVAMAALKYGDLSNQASKDYIFDMEKFTSFEGDTGPYLLYTMVRIKSILRRFEEAGGKRAADCVLIDGAGASEKVLRRTMCRFSEMMKAAHQESAPHRLCAYVYELCNDFNSFYHENRILAEKDEALKESWIALLSLALSLLETSISCLGFSAPERM